MTLLHEKVVTQNYTIQSQIGQGSCAKVYAVIEKSSGDLLILKERKSTYDALTEAKLLKSLRDHPCIVLFKDAFYIAQSQTICLLMERAKIDLEKTLETQYVCRHRQVPIALACSWIAQIALGLENVHDLHILHRDVKPANLFFLPDNRLVLGDFGVSKRVMPSTDCTKTFLGTPFYLSPEIMLRHEYDEKSDVWAFGCVAFEIATTKRPFSAVKFHELETRVINGRVNWSLARESPFLRILDRCLELDSTKRASMAEILKIPVISNGLSEFLSDLVQGKFKLSQVRAQTLLNQMKRLGLEGVALAGLKKGKALKEETKRFTS